MDKLEGYRRKIDIINRKIARLLSQRFDLVQQIKHYKKINKIKISDRKRELKVLNNVKKYSKKQYQKFIIKIFKTIINFSKKLQSK